MDKLELFGSKITVAHRGNTNLSIPVQYIYICTGIDKFVLPLWATVQNGLVKVRSTTLKAIIIISTPECIFCRDDEIKVIIKQCSTLTLDKDKLHNGPQVPQAHVLFTTLHQH